MSESTELTISVKPRADEVLEAINSIKHNIVNGFLALGRLLGEARDNQYHVIWGYTRFDEWVESASGLDLSAREAYYLVNIVKRSAELGIPDEQLERVKISKLKAIMSLPETTDPEQIKGLVQEAEHMSLKNVKAVTGTLKNEDFTYHTLKFDRDTEDNVYQPAVERQRRIYGDTISSSGEPADISESKVVELWAAECLAGADAPEPVEGEFEDIVEPVPQAA